MELREARLDTVAFLCLEKMTDAGMDMCPHATVFFVGDTDVDRPHPVWAVTARHCIEEMRAQTAPAAVRVNAGDSYVDVPTRPDDWWESDDADVACCYWASTEGEVRVIPLKQLVRANLTYPFGQLTFEDGNEGWGETQAHLGAEVFFVGLFSQHAGKARNLPIARFGNVSRLPREAIAVNRPWGNESIPGYLVEAHSWGGHSGSPAYWADPVMAVVELPDGSNVSVPQRLVALLGLVSAHFDIDRQATTTGEVLGRVTAPDNSGIAVVTPAHFIRQLIDRSDVREQAAEYRRKYDSDGAATADMLDFVPESDAD